MSAIQVNETDATNLVVRTNGNLTSLADAVRDVIWSVDRNVPVVDVLTLDDHMEMEVRGTRCLSLGARNLRRPGLLRSPAAPRDRPANGAGGDTNSVTGMVLRHGFRFTLIGFVLGIGVAFAGTRLMSSLLFGVLPQDPLTFGSVAVLLFVVAIAACIGPARAASRVDPMRVLQEE